MPFNSQSIALWLACVLMAIPLRADEEKKPDSDAPTFEVAGSLTIPVVAATNFALSPDGERLVAPLENDRIAVWNLASGDQEVVMKEKHDWQIMQVAFHPDGQSVATASLDKTAKFWDASTGKLLATLKGHTDRLEYAATYSPKGKYFFTSTAKTWPYEKYGPVEARIWNARTGKFVAELKSHMNTITRAVFSKDEAHVLTASDDHTARLWDVSTGKELHKFELGSKIETAVFSPDGKTILAASSGVPNAYAATTLLTLPVEPPPAESVVKLWDAKSGKELLDLPHPPLARDPRLVSHTEVRAFFNKAGDQILTERRGLITYWDVATGKKLATLREAVLPPPRVIFSPNREFFAVLQFAQPGELWSVSEKKKVGKVKATSLFSFFSPNGKTFYSLQSGKFRWWSLDGLK